MTDEVTIPTGDGDVPALLHVPADATWLYLFAHGAGAGMRHHFMSDVAERFAGLRIATLRYEFAYMAAGSRRPDSAPNLTARVRAVAEYAAREFAGLRIAAGGKSMGGRMTSQAQAAAPLPRVERLIFTGFPLHPAGSPGTSRADHLADVAIPMLFLQGTRDSLADLSLLRPVLDALGPRATLHVIDGADHGFGVRKSSASSSEDVLAEIARTIRDWLGA